MKNGKSIILVGATGLVGSEILRFALDDDRVKSVLVLGRRGTGITHEKLTEHIVDFDRIEEIAPLVKGDMLISCLGTTKRAAGTKEAQYRVDYTYQYLIAQKAKLNAVKTMVLISSARATPHSHFFYLKTKGELERDIEKLGFKYLRILRPGPLLGHRKVKRFGEEIFNSLLLKLPASLGRNYLHPVHALTVADVVFKVAFLAEEIIRVEPNKFKELEFGKFAT